jgi:hypothetical protein
MTGMEVAALANLLLSGGGMYAGQKKAEAQGMMAAQQQKGQLQQQAQQQATQNTQNQLNDVINSYRQMLLG